MTSITKIPTLSSEVIAFYFDKDIKELEVKSARGVIELQPPQTQGLNTLALAEYIIDLGDLGKENPYYNRAVFFKTQWDSGNCYICGLQINGTGHTMELEHVLPVAEAHALTGIIQKKRKDFVNIDNLKALVNKPYALKYLLEYARSHRCCNQLKSATSFLEFDLSETDVKKRYTPNLIGINKILNEIYVQGYGLSKTPKFQEEEACANKSFRTDLKTRWKDKKLFIEARYNFIVENYINPIINEINDLIGVTSFEFAQLVFMANQAMSIDQNIWKTLTGAPLKGSTSAEILEVLYTNTEKLNYKNTKEPIALKLIEFINKFTGTFKNKAIEYVSSNLRQSGSTKKPSDRIVDKNTLMGFLNIDYNFYTKIYFENIKSLNDNYTGLTFDNEGLYGFQYMYYLIKNQNPSINFTKDQVINFNNMMKNINDFMIFYIYIYIIFYNPFIGLKKDIKVCERITFNDINLPRDLSLLETFNLEIQTNQGMIEIHENYCSNIFFNLNYLIKRELRQYTDASKVEYMYINIRELENYGLFVIESTKQQVGAEYFIYFANQACADYNAEYNLLKDNPQFNKPPVGGIIRKKTRKNNSTKRKTKTRKIRKIRKNKKSKRKLRYTKKY